MSKRRGLSVDEKRQRMLQLFHERRDFLQLKELERMGARDKGVVAQSVKDIVQSLVDDALVDTDKIGTCVYFWALPSRAVAQRQQRLQQLRNRQLQLQQLLTERRQQLQLLGRGHEPSEERQQLQQQLQQRRQQLQQLQQQLQQLADCDPQTVQQLRQQLAEARAAVDRWTDNVFNVRSWCCSRLSMESSTIDRHFGIGDDFDYLQ